MRGGLFTLAAVAVGMVPTVAGRFWGPTRPDPAPSALFLPAVATATAAPTVENAPARPATASVALSGDLVPPPPAVAASSPQAAPATAGTSAPAAVATPQAGPTVIYVTPPAPAPVVPTVPTVPIATAPGVAADPYGFLGCLNAIRAGYGLRSVVHDAGLSAWAARNNGVQSTHGLGHFIIPKCRQNAAVAPGYSAAQVAALWMGSKGHRATMLAPDITAVGIASNGRYWTMNAR